MSAREHDPVLVERAVQALRRPGLTTWRQDVITVLDAVADDIARAERERVLTAAMRDVADERQKQIDKGYTPEHDDEHTPSRILSYGGILWNRVTRPQLVRLAACAIAAIERYDRGYTLPGGGEGK